MARTEVQTIRDWLKALGSLCAGSTSSEDANRKLTAYAPLLAADFSLGAFTPASLAAIARQCKFFPSYAELCEHLAGWWREHRPPPSAHLLRDPKSKTHDEWRVEAELSWSTVTAVDIRAKVAATERIAVDAHRTSLGRMLGVAVARHAPHYLALIPPQWQDKPT